MSATPSVETRIERSKLPWRIKLSLLNRYRKTVYSPGVPWKNGYRSLWSLADMLKALNVSDFDHIVEDIRAAEQGLAELIADGKRDTYLNPGQPGYEFVERLESAVDRIPTEFVDEAMDKRFKRAMDSVVTSTVEEIHHEARTLREMIEDGLQGRLFLHISKHMFFEQEALFGSKVEDTFPGASRDIRQAGNCYSLEQYTACVFHCMRVLEHGLIALAAQLSVKFELEEWGRIIDRTEAAIKAIDQEPKTSQKKERQQFYSDAAAQFRYFKNAWRNHSMHAREHYDENEATRILEHVRDFMQHLATRLSEITTTRNE